MQQHLCVSFRCAASQQCLLISFQSCTCVQHATWTPHSFSVSAFRNNPTPQQRRCHLPWHRHKNDYRKASKPVPPCALENVVLLVPHGNHVLSVFLVNCLHTFLFSLPQPTHTQLCHRGQVSSLSFRHIYNYRNCFILHMSVKHPPAWLRVPSLQFVCFLLPVVTCLTQLLPRTRNRRRAARLFFSPHACMYFKSFHNLCTVAVISHLAYQIASYLGIMNSSLCLLLKRKPVSYLPFY